MPKTFMHKHGQLVLTSGFLQYCIATLTSSLDITHGVTR